MRLVASSHPEDVGRDQAIHLLTERAVMTRAICRELREGGEYCASRRHSVALSMLLQWVYRNLPQSVRGEPHASDGLDKMVVPDDCHELMREIRDGASVCEDLFMLTTADTPSQEEGDTERIRRALDAYWAAHVIAVSPPRTRRL